MSNHPMFLPILLGGMSVVLGIASLVLFYVMMIRPKIKPEMLAAKTTASRHHHAQERTADDGDDQDKAVSAHDVNAPTLSQADVRTQNQKDKKSKTEQCLFVVFDTPSKQINQALGEILAEKKAFYEAEIGAFHLPPGERGYPLLVASATSPGKLPPLHQSGDYPLVKGISILLRFVNVRRAARHPDDLIAFAREVASMGGEILDARQQPIGEEGLRNMYPKEERGG